MAAGSEPPYIAAILDYLRPLSEGLSLCGAGAGGYGAVILKREVDRLSLEQSVMELNRTLAYRYPECVGSKLSVHEVSISNEGITVDEMMIGDMGADIFLCLLN